ncbi:squalene--hopene cyclase [Shouchella patagoniensis]|uniref:squalene--hopene cyclase n=1 Tax=Shouchella patagoniensis TaxID=228576 RepID=UPI000994C2AC|nr:squalene--hopene cyclase [Shouchella patagoniensis]
MKTTEGINFLIEKLRTDQSEAGSWEYPFEAGTFTDAYMIVLLRTLEINDEALIKSLTERLVSRQESNGAWKLYRDDGDGNVTSTVEGYYALLYSGYYKPEDERLQKANRFILANGGIEKTTLLTKIMLTLTGQYQWPKFFPLPVELILLPLYSPVNLFSMSVYGRAHIVPLIVAADKKYQLKTAKSPDLSNLFVSSREDSFIAWAESDEARKLHSFITDSVKKLFGLPKDVRRLSLSRAKLYMTNATEPDGTLFSYFTSTFFMIFALLALGHKKEDPLIKAAVAGLYTFQTKVKGHTHIQFTTASVWNTSLISYALQEAGVSATDPMVEKATMFLLKRQQSKYGDWAIHNKKSKPGGWGFSNVNTIQPDMDDSTSTLRALTGKASLDKTVYVSWNKGTNWVVAMQNRDGGWAAFEKNTNSLLLSLLPIQEAKGILTDPSTPDLTGRTMEYLGTFANVTKEGPELSNGVRWLRKNQEKNGSWEGQWGVQYIYGTWAALTGLAAAGVSTDESIQKAVKWLKAIQNKDGGWGESCLSDRNKTYTPLAASTLTHTAWALDALVSVSDQPDKNMIEAMHFLLKSLNQVDWREEYPAGKGLADRIYFHYHSYRYLFPLLALAHYQNKYN